MTNFSQTKNLSAIALALMPILSMGQQYLTNQQPLAGVGGNAGKADAQASIALPPDCPAGQGWVAPGGGISYSHCSAAGPSTTYKPVRGMTAQDVCGLNSGASYVWNTSNQTCSIPPPPPAPVAPIVPPPTNPVGPDGGEYSPGPAPSPSSATDCGGSCADINGYGMGCPDADGGGWGGTGSGGPGDGGGSGGTGSGGPGPQ
jgi:hypothetical protein